MRACAVCPDAEVAVVTKRSKPGRKVVIDQPFHHGCAGYAVFALFVSVAVDVVYAQEGLVVFATARTKQAIMLEHHLPHSVAPAFFYIIDLRSISCFVS